MGPGPHPEVSFHAQVRLGLYLPVSKTEFEPQLAYHLHRLCPSSNV